jgi:excisionase family DNA binding protein
VGRTTKGEPEVACVSASEHRWAAHEWAGQWLSGTSRTLTTVEAAALLGVSTDSVRHFVAAGRLSQLGTRRRARFDVAEVKHLHTELWERAS